MSLRFDLDESYELTPGEDLPFTWTVKDEATGALIDVSGWSLAWYLLPTPNSALGSALVTKDSTAGITVATSAVTVQLNATDTAALPPQTYAYELWRTDGGQRFRLAFGVFVLNP